MQPLRKLTTKEKALQINLRPDIYGSFAEIGAGQEVAANFFKAGGSSGTVAKTMSAYDMTFSDAIYGASQRYVCEARLIRMLQKEYNLLGDRLPERVQSTRFFAFANTVEALNYQKTNQPHGWVGLRFQLRPDTPFNECVVHVKMHDNDNVLQQQALGIIGVNLIFGALFFPDPEEMLDSLMDNLSSGRIEIDMFRLSGPDFEHVDNRLMCLKLVKNGMTRATIFGPDGNVMQPSEFLYKKNVLILRGRFRPVTLVNVDMLLTGRRHFKKEEDVKKDKMLLLTELTLNDLTSEKGIDDRDFLHRVDIICSLGQNVMISNYPEYYRLADYLSRFTKGQKIGLILGIDNLLKVFEEKYYEELSGGLLEAFGTLFGKNVILYVYPTLTAGSQEVLTLDKMENKLPANQRSLFQYLLQNEKLKMIDGADSRLLHIKSNEVLSKIKSGETGWEDDVPKKVVAAIKSNCLFDYPCSPEAFTTAQKALKAQQLKLNNPSK